jgi:hypothetical protein
MFCNEIMDPTLDKRSAVGGDGELHGHNQGVKAVNWNPRSITNFEQK